MLIEPQIVETEYNTKISDKKQLNQIRDVRFFMTILGWYFIENSER